MANLGEVILNRGRVNDAAQLLRVAAEKARKTVPPTDWTLPNILAKWGRCQVLLRRPAEAKSTLRESVELYGKTLGPEDDRTRSAEKLLATLE